MSAALDFGKLLQSALDHRGQSQKWLSKESGVSMGTITGIIYQKKIPRIDTAMRLCRALGFSISEVFEPDSSVLQHAELHPNVTKVLKKDIQRFEKHITHIMNSLQNLKTSIAENEQTPSSRVFEGSAQYLDAYDSEALTKSEYPEDMIALPDYEEIAAGSPRAIEATGKTKHIPRKTLPRRADPHDYGVFTIRGESMGKLGFYNGDVILAHQQNDARKGDLVIAYIGDEDGCTFKKLDIVPWASNSSSNGGYNYYLCWEDGSRKRMRMRFPRDRICGVFVKKIAS